MSERPVNLVTLEKNLRANQRTKDVFKYAVSEWPAASESRTVYIYLSHHLTEMHGLPTVWSGCPVEYRVIR
ncbi:hypothetical protein LRY58_05205 [Candidatus Woesebacteria bacterium]|nr:hypothetical protein [Candidatus Woesebacteria bacterium]MCD8546500.1 hypothetical protein [Candidatus Woesebacteria bacterium]